MKKDLDYYMNLLYTIEIVSIPESQGGGFSACLPEIGRYTAVGDGETIQEAILDLEKIKRERFSAYLKKSVSIPEPAAEQTFSGNFMLRLPPRLHMALTERAKLDHLSLNQWVKTILEKELLLKNESNKNKGREDRLLASNEQILRKQELLEKRLESLEETINEQLWDSIATNTETTFVSDHLLGIIPTLINDSLYIDKYDPATIASVLHELKDENLKV